MFFWMSCLLLLAAIAGIVFLAFRASKKGFKPSYILSIIALAVIALVLIFYIALTVLFLNSIP